MATTITGAASHKAIRLGGELRGYRVDANLRLSDTVAALKARAGVTTSWDTTKLSRIERAQLLISPAELKDLLDHYAVTGEDRIDLESLLTDGVSVRWWRDFDDVISPAFAEYLGLENEAAETWEYTAGSTFPGLVQTSEYAAETITAGIDGPGDDQVEAGATVRTMRQRRLTREPVLRHTAYFSEVALQVAGDRKVLAGQIRRAIEVAQDGTVTLRMVPLSAGRRGILASGLVLMRFPEPGSLKFVFVEAVGGMLPRGSGREVPRAERAFRRLDGLALSTRDTIAALQEELEKHS